MNTALHTIDLSAAIPESANYLAAAQSAYANTLAQLQALPATEAAEAQAVALIKQWTETGKSLDATRTSWRSLVQPILDRIDGMYKPARHVCDDAVKALKQWLEGSQAHRRAEVQRQLAAAAALAAQAPEQARVELARATSAAVQTPAGIRKVVRWSARVVDPGAVPAQYWVVDQSKLDAEAKVVKGQAAPPPGVEWVATESLERSGR